MSDVLIHEAIKTVRHLCNYHIANCKRVDDFTNILLDLGIQLTFSESTMNLIRNAQLGKEGELMAEHYKTVVSNVLDLSCKDFIPEIDSTYLETKEFPVLSEAILLLSLERINRKIPETVEFNNKQCCPYCGSHNTSYYKACGQCNACNMYWNFPSYLRFQDSEFKGRGTGRVIKSTRGLS